MSGECRIFKPSNNGNLRLVETVSHQEIVKTTDRKSLFNAYPKREQKLQPRRKKLKEER